MKSSNSVVAFGLGFILGKKGLEFGERFLYWTLIIALVVGLLISEKII